MSKSGGEMGGDGMASGSSPGGNGFIRRPTICITALILGVAVSCLILYNSANPFQFLPGSFQFTRTASFFRFDNTSEGNLDPNLDKILRNASMADGTVILTTLNEAWAEPESIFDVFLESFRIGNNTQRLLNHLVVISMDPKAHNRCLSVHPHCYALDIDGLNCTGEAYYMTPIYLEMMWRRVRLLASVLQMGYSFVFTDADIVWLQDPFPRFYKNADFQIACDVYKGNPYNKRNMPNGGFTYVKSNRRTIQFYKFWYAARDAYPGRHDQDVLNKIKYHPFLAKIGLKMRFLDTAYFGGFCQPSKHLNLACTMHANCCFGLKNKVQDLKIVLDDWRGFMALPSTVRTASPSSWTAPKHCHL